MASSMASLEKVMPSISTILGVTRTTWFDVFFTVCVNNPRKSATVISFKPAVNVPMCSKRVVRGRSYSSNGAKLSVVELSLATLPNMSQMKNVVRMRVARSGELFLKRMVNTTSESRWHSGSDSCSSNSMERFSA